MGMKFLNKKGWHTGSLRNIENVWKAEQKHDVEQKKLEELRKQIGEERERAEFRQLQEQAGLLPKQERLDFLYESGLAVGKASASEGFKALEAFPKPDEAPSSSAAATSQQSAVPGALFEEKPHSANDQWRKLHSDPLLMIRQREQEALARVKNNPVQMAMIRKSVEEKHKKKKKKKSKNSDDEKEHRKKHHHSSSKHQKHSSPSRDDRERSKTDHRKSSNRDSEDESKRKDSRSEKKNNPNSKDREQSPSYPSDRDTERNRQEKNNHRGSKYRQQSPGDQLDRDNVRNRRENDNFRSLKYREQSPGDQLDRDSARNRWENANYRGSKNREQSPGDQLDRDSARNRRENENYRGSKHREQSPDGRSNRNTLRGRQEKEHYRGSTHRHQSPGGPSDGETARDRRETENLRASRHIDRSPRGQSDRETAGKRREPPINHGKSEEKKDKSEVRQVSQQQRRKAAPKLTKEEQEARLREMQMDAELHEDQRWKRLKKAAEDDELEASRAALSSTTGKNFLDAAQKSIYGTEKGGSASIAESVRRRAHYSQNRSENGNAFRR